MRLNSSNLENKLMTHYECVEAPLWEPISLDEAKLYLKVDSDEEDALIADLIKAARMWCEEQLGKLLQKQTWRAIFPYGGAKEFVLKKGPVNALTKLQLRYGKKTREVEADHFIHQRNCDAYILKPRYYLANVNGTLEVEYEAGYETVPAPLKQAVLLALAQFYEYRGEKDAPNLEPVIKLMRPFCLPGV
jgi:uncharacterized phiE125 gp8 family phage protein